MQNLDPILLSAEEADRLCRLSIRTWWRYDACERIPIAFALGNSGRTKRWRRSDIIDWTDCGCLPGDEFQSSKENLI
ncbi:MAG: hypothetical protein RJP95_01145 [Pirellulales bacterium]